MTPVLKIGHSLVHHQSPSQGDPEQHFAAPGHLFSGVDSKIDDPIETDRTAEAEVSWLRAESQRKSKKMRLLYISFDT